MDQLFGNPFPHIAPQRRLLHIHIISMRVLRSPLELSPCPIFWRIQVLHGPSCPMLLLSRFRHVKCVDWQWAGQWRWQQMILVHPEQLFAHYPNPRLKAPLTGSEQPRAEPLFPKEPLSICTEDPQNRTLLHFLAYLSIQPSPLFPVQFFARLLFMLASIEFVHSVFYDIKNSVGKIHSAVRIQGFISLLSYFGFWVFCRVLGYWALFVSWPFVNWAFRGFVLDPLRRADIEF